MKTLPRLSDLYTVGNTFAVTADTPQGHIEIPIYIQKLNPNEHDQCMVAANAKRSVILTMKRYHNDDEKPLEYLAIQSDIADLMADRVHLQDYLSLMEVIQKKQRCIAEVAAYDEWAEDGYYRGLLVAWNEGLEDRYGENPEDPEAKRVFAELERFEEDVEALLAPKREQIVSKYIRMSEDELVEEATNLLIDNRANAVWINEFRMNQIYWTVRNPDTKERYFESVQEVRETDPRIIGQITEFVESLEMDPLEGKDSQESTSS